MFRSGRVFPCENIVSPVMSLPKLAAGLSDYNDVAVTIGSDPVGLLPVICAELISPQRNTIDVQFPDERVPVPGQGSFKVAFRVADDYDITGLVNGYSGHVISVSPTELVRPNMITVRVELLYERVPLTRKHAFEIAGSLACDDNAALRVDGDALRFVKLRTADLRSPEYLAISIKIAYESVSPAMRCTAEDAFRVASYDDIAVGINGCGPHPISFAAADLARPKGKAVRIQFADEPVRTASREGIFEVTGSIDGDDDVPGGIESDGSYSFSSGLRRAYLVRPGVRAVRVFFADEPVRISSCKRSFEVALGPATDDNAAVSMNSYAASKVAFGCTELIRPQCVAVTGIKCLHKSIPDCTGLP